MKIVSTTSKQRIWAYNAPVFGVKKEIPAKMEGNPQVLAQLGSTMVKFDNWFEVLPGTKKKSVEEPKTEVFLDDDPVVIRPEN